jgi:integration host factor subunit beta
MTKSDLIEHLCLTKKLSKGRAETLLNTILESIEQSLRRGERIEIRGFGSFEIRNYSAYQGRNPRTGTTVPVAPKRLPFFKVGKELKERVNSRLPPKSRPASTGVGSHENGAPSERGGTPGLESGASQAMPRSRATG